MTTTIIATAIVLGVLIFVHELGHFLTAKWVDIEVPRFSIGFGPKILGFRRGETEYVISLLPLGGYVKMAGMEELEAIEGRAEPRPAAGEAGPHGSARGRAADRGMGATAGAGAAGPRPRDFEAKSLPARTLVISAGVIMNLLFAVVAYTSIALFWGVPTIPPSIVGGISEELLPPGATALATLHQGDDIVRVGDSPVTDFFELQTAMSAAEPGPLEIALADGRTLTIQMPDNDSVRADIIGAIEPVAVMAADVFDVSEDGPAARAGVEPGDRIVAAAGEPVETWQDLTAQIETRAGQPVPLRVDRAGDTLDLTVVPEARTLEGGYQYGRIGISAGAIAISTRQPVGPIAAAGYGFSETGRWVGLTLKFLADLFKGDESPRNLGGPIAIAQISGQAAAAGFQPLLAFMALLSVNLAILNLLPIPVLDGGQLVFLAIEAVRGRALSIQQRMRAAQVGFIIILAIMAFAIGNDILRWVGF